VTVISPEAGGDGSSDLGGLLVGTGRFSPGKVVLGEVGEPAPGAAESPAGAAHPAETASNAAKTRMTARVRIVDRTLPARLRFRLSTGRHGPALCADSCHPRTAS